MNILFSIPLYVPVFNCGSEVVAHLIAKELVKRKHQVRVVVHKSHEKQAKYPYTYEKIEVFNNDAADHIQWADVVITHLDSAVWTIPECRRQGKPCYFIAHNDHRYNEIKKDVKVIFNSKWIADLWNFEGQSIVFPPPVDKWYKVKDQEPEYITLINLSENKGYKTFYMLAKRFPQYKFMGVIGSYGRQIIYQYNNVTIHPNTADIRQVYAKTKVLLMPSLYESWGKTATEAAINGIPVICCPTPGLMENLGNAGIFLKRNQFEDWIQWLKRLMEDETFYKHWSDRVKKRAAELSPDWDKLITFITQR